MKTDQYLQQHPECALHMISLPGVKANLETGMFLVDPNDHFCVYPGGYIQWRIQDTRKFTEMGFSGWEKWLHVPFRVYVDDYDDWNAERQYPSLEEAREAISLLNTGGTVSYKDIYSLGIKPI